MGMGPGAAHLDLVQRGLGEERQSDRVILLSQSRMTGIAFALLHLLRFSLGAEDMSSYVPSVGRARNSDVGSGAVEKARTAAENRAKAGMAARRAAPGGCG